MYANWTPSVTWSLLEGSSTGDMRGREGGRDSKVWHKLCNRRRGESVMNVQRVGGGSMREGQREGGRGRH